jgi:hypothetical protein
MLMLELSQHLIWSWSVTSITRCNWCARRAAWVDVRELYERERRSGPLPRASDLLLVTTSQKATGNQRRTDVPHWLSLPCQQPQ